MRSPLTADDRSRYAVDEVDEKVVPTSSIEAKMVIAAPHKMTIRPLPEFYINNYRDPDHEIKSWIN